MSSSGKVVEVLCPNGRRQKVKVLPSMTVLQILQQVCSKQGFDENEYDLKHQQKVLLVTSIMRYLNLANNAKLEMVKCNKPRAASTVIVALQLEDGTRFQKEFDPTKTLKEILTAFETDNGGELLNQRSVCVYMRNEYKGGEVLSTINLKAMGITSGRAAIRLLFRDVEIVEIPLKNSKDENNVPLCEINRSVEKLEEPELKRQKIQEDSDKKEQITVIPERIYGPPSRQVFPDDAVMQTDIMPNHTVAESSNLMSTAAPAPIQNEFANFKFPDKSEADDDDLAIDPHLLKTEVKLSMPCNREVITYKIEETEETLNPNTEELSDKFFEVTINDLKKRMSDLKSQRATQEEALLMTQAGRKRKELDKIAAFNTIPIRFQFPDKTILQAFFRPLETVGTLKEFLREYISEDLKKFQIFTAPPKVVLKANSETLYEAKLFPAALVYFSTDIKTSFFLKEEFNSALKSYEEAEILLRHNLKRHGSSEDIKNSSASSSNNKYKDTSKSKFSSTNSSSSSQGKSKNTPKWFKTGR